MQIVSLEISNKNYICQIDKMIEEHNIQLNFLFQEKENFEKLNQKIIEENHFEMGNLKKV